MRLRDLFRSQTTNERKLTSSILPVLDVNTFINAALDKDIDTLQKYLYAGFPPDQPDPLTRVTALHIAVESANLRFVQILLQAGAQVNVCDSSFSTPLHIAAYMGFEEIVQILLINGADMFYRDNTGRNSFHLAVSTGNNRLVQYFLLHMNTEQSIINTTDAYNWTPFMCACASIHPSTCTFLLSYGADISAINDRGMNVFHIAAFLGSISLVHELLNSSIDEEILLTTLNQGDNRNQTPLFYACVEGHLDVALTLLHAGANAYHIDNDKQTCLHAMLSSSIILKRHIRLFYRFIEFVDFRFHQDNLSRTLLDLAYLNQINTIIYLLILLNYKRNYAILSHDDYYDSTSSTQIYSLRQLCILSFKRSIIYHQNQKQLSQHELLENALQQIFHININGDTAAASTTELSDKKSFDDLSGINKKNSKTIKKSRKTLNIYSTIQHDIEQHAQSSWSIFTNKFKPQRTSTAQQESTSTPTVITNHEHPMKNLALAILISPSKLDDLLDFPSLNNNNHLLLEDIKTAMNNYKLDGADSSNEI
ncbi:unnamed protein product [Adineta steineri]|uniref:Ankyrin repeat protein n=1 Tax=Adineta steineri TaxID=433720 RepID=A0A818V4Y6_9BILA|nr:unnamed protein product [Adineta steineri]